MTRSDIVDLHNMLIWWPVGWVAFFAFLMLVATPRPWRRWDVGFALVFAFFWPIVGLPFIIAGLINDRRGKS